MSFLPAIRALRRGPRRGGSPAGAPGVEEFAHFLHAIGHRVVRGAGAYWYDAGRGFFLAVPSHRLLVPDATALQGMLWRNRWLGVRFPAPLEGPGQAELPDRLRRPRLRAREA